MKRLLMLLLVLIGLFVFPFKFSTLPDEWTLKAKNYIKEQQIQKEEPEKRVKKITGRIKFGMSEQMVEKQLGKPKRSLLNQFDNKWIIYHQSYQHFVMVGYINHKVAAIYSNDSQYIDKSLRNKDLNSIIKLKGRPLSTEVGQDYRVRLSEENILQYQSDGLRTTYYYDQFDAKIDAIMLMTEDYFNRKPRYYANPSDTLAASFEQLDFELINAARVKRGLPSLQYHDKLSQTALHHSEDMVEYHYFDHINQQNQSPFDRMSEDGIEFVRAGENLAAGQVSAIEAHHGLMNSAGHRKNILHPDYQQIGIGVTFNENNHPYYTENYLTEN